MKKKKPIFYKLNPEEVSSTGVEYELIPKTNLDSEESSSPNLLFSVTSYPDREHIQQSGKDLGNLKIFVPPSSEQGKNNQNENS